MPDFSIGSGSDKLVLGVSDDAYQGDAQFTVSVDGQQIDGTLTTLTPHASRSFDVLSVFGDWAPGSHVVTVNFLNDAWDGTDATDRNLYLNLAYYNGTDISGAAQELSSSGPVSFGITDSTPVPAVGTTATVGSGIDTLALRVSEDAYGGDAQFTVSVDGQQVGGTLTATSLHGSGQSDVVNVRGNWAAGPHAVTVNFLNDAWDGTPDTDRNLYVDSATFNGAAVSSATLTLSSGGPQGFGLTDPGSTIIWPNPNIVYPSPPPQPEVNQGDTLVITAGTFTAQDGQLSGVTVYLNGTQTAPATLAVQDGFVGNLRLSSFFSPTRYSTYGTLDVTGTVTIGNQLQWGGRVAPSSMNVNLNGSATLNLNGVSLGRAASFVVNGSPGSTVTNTGDMSLSTTNEFAIHADLAGTGTIQSLDAADSYGVTIELDGAVSAGQTVDLNGGTLQLGQPMRFMGTVANLTPSYPNGGPHSDIVLEHTTVTGTSFQQLTSNAGDLSIFTQDPGTGAASTAIIHVAGSFAPNAFMFNNNTATQSALIQLSPPHAAS